MKILRWLATPFVLAWTLVRGAIMLVALLFEDIWKHRKDA